MQQRTVLGMVTAARVPHQSLSSVLGEDALGFLARLESAFGARRRDLLQARRQRQAEYDLGKLPAFDPATQALRDASWSVDPAPGPLRDRRVEITGPCDRKMMINALNSGAQVFMADLEDATSPTWENVLEAQLNLMDAVCGRLSHRNADGRAYRVGPNPATLVVRPRGWHLEEPNVQVAGQNVSASLFDVGLFLWHNARILQHRGAGPYLYLPKLESAAEATLWNDVLDAIETELRLPIGCTKVSVLIETLPAAFQMEEILHALRHRCVALNAGRWDYLFSTIKVHRALDLVLPDRDDLSMGTTFLWAYAQRLVRTCHKRGAYAIGGMAAHVPDRHDHARNALALAAVRNDKLREAADGFDGTWVAHPDLVPLARRAFDERMGGSTDQLGVLREDTRVGAAEMLFVHVPSASCTAKGLSKNVRVAITYLAHWLAGTGAVAIDGRMEDTATAEISRSQVWQWVRRGVVLDNGRTVTGDLVRTLVATHRAALASSLPERAAARLGDACTLFEMAALAPQLPEFVTLLGQDMLEASA